MDQPSLDFEDATLQGQFAHLVRSCLDLDIRIALLCHALGLELVSGAQLQGILDRTAPGFAAAPSLRGPGMAVDRAQVEREELRGLLVMRFELLTRAVHEGGREVAAQMVELIRAELQQRGLVRAADGLELLEGQAAATPVDRGR